jgi:outer membrane usher protein
VLLPARHPPFLLWVIIVAITPCRSAVADANDPGRERWVEVTLNGVLHPDFALLRIDSRGALYVRRSDVNAWHMTIIPGASAQLNDEDASVRIDNIPGLHARLDHDETQLNIEADPSLFGTHYIRGSRHSGSPDEGLPAFFADYDLFGERSDSGVRDFSGRAQIGSSFERASLTSSWLATYQSNESVLASGSPAPPNWARLDTALLLDWPELTARLSVGDSITQPGTLGQSVRFGGIHWATDYTTQPGVTPYALPAFSGTAAVPSSVELYLNQSLLQRTPIDPGPFEYRTYLFPSDRVMWKSTCEICWAGIRCSASRIWSAPTCCHRGLR